MIIRYLLSLLLSFCNITYLPQQGTVIIPLPSEQNYPPRILCQRFSRNTTRCSNWAGTKTWTPSDIVMPKNEEELSIFLKTSLHFKIVGYGHSWAGLYIPTDHEGNRGTTLVLHHLSGITHFQNQHGCSASSDLPQITHVEVMAGTSFVELHHTLDDAGLALSWQSGGIQGLTVGGAISVGYHGSQLSSSSISSVVDSLTVYDTLGHPHFLTVQDNSSLMFAARLGLGVCGVITRATLPVEPRFYLRRRRWKEPDMSLFFLQKLSPLKSNYDRFHYYVHPHSHSVWPMFWEHVTPQESRNEARPCRTALDQWEDGLEKEYGQDGLPLIMRWDNCSDLSYNAYTHAVDMEAQPLWNGEWFVNLTDKDANDEADIVLAILDVFQNIALALEPNKKPDIDLWLHVRYMRGDDIYLHPCYGWTHCAGFELALVAKGLKESLPSADNWYRYFLPFENYLKTKGGRPHWAKDHTPDAEYMSRSGLDISSFLEECKLLNIEHRQGFHREL